MIFGSIPAALAPAVICAKRTGLPVPEVVGARGVPAAEADVPGAPPAHSKCIKSFLPCQSPPHVSPYFAAICETSAGRSVLLPPKLFCDGLISIAFPKACSERDEPPRFSRLL